jgi:hypothetical protein
MPSLIATLSSSIPSPLSRLRFFAGILFTFEFNVQLFVSVVLQRKKKIAD